MSVKAKTWVALWIVYIIWGSTYLGIQIAGETIPIMLAASTRFLAAGALMALIVMRSKGSLRMRRRELLSCALVGALLPGANAVLFFAEQHIDIGIASLLIASVPLWVVVMRLGLREHMPTLAIGGVVIGFAGIALLLRPHGGATGLGIGLCVLSAVMWAVGSLLSSRLPMPANSLAATTWEMLIGGALMLPFAAFTTHHFAPSTSSIVAWIYLVTIGSIVGYSAYTWLLVNAPIGLVSTYAYVNPVVAIALGIAFRGEHLTVLAIIGAAIVVGSVAVVVREEPPATPTPE